MSVMDYRFLVLAVILMAWAGHFRVFGVGTVVFDVEAEDMTSYGTHTYHRAGASNKKAIHVFAHDVISTELCLMSPTTVEVEQVAYSNDGGSDEILITLEGTILGVFHTLSVSNGGNEWGNFRSSGKLMSKFIHTGRHRLSLKVLNTDTYGVEIDFIRLRIGNTQSNASLRCQVFCFEEIYYEDTQKHQKKPEEGEARQNSVKTLCAETDNVNIPIFHPTVTRFMISASLPKYRSFSNNRGTDWTDCGEGKGNFAFWNFTKIIFKDKYVRKSSKGSLSFHAAAPDVNKTTLIGTIYIEFLLTGQSSGSTDADIGMRIFLNGIKHQQPLTFNFQYKGRYAHWSNPKNVTIGGNNRTLTFYTPDFVFMEGNKNKVRIEVFGDETLTTDMSIDELFMVTRYFKSDSPTIIYDDSLTIIESVKTDMWWQLNQTMTVTLSTDAEVKYEDTDFCRIYQKIPWGKTFSQLFVIYQDGNVRLLPFTPPGLDWIPFGSSVLIGQSNSSSDRPIAGIRHLHVDPLSLKIKVYYLDGGIVNLQIKTTLTETQVIILDSTFTQDLNLFPFFTFRSMWVRDGNGDVDHIAVDGASGNADKGIIGDWKTIRGHFFAFYRKCISKHNTLSPDISLTILP